MLRCWRFHSLTRARSFSDKLKLMSFQEALLFLQHPPTSQWGAEEMEMLLSRAFVLQETFGSKSGANE